MFDEDYIQEFIKERGLEGVVEAYWEVAASEWFNLFLSQIIYTQIFSFPVSSICAWYSSTDIAQISLFDLNWSLA